MSDETQVAINLDDAVILKHASDQYYNMSVKGHFGMGANWKMSLERTLVRIEQAIKKAKEEQSRTFQDTGPR